MSNQLYQAVTGTLFTVVALAHLARVLNGWSVQVADWSIPMVVSWVGAVIPALLAITAFSLLRGSKTSN